MDDRFEWIEEWPSPGVCRLAQARVVLRGDEAARLDQATSFCGIWMLVHENEAALLEAPFAPEDAGPILERLRGWLEERKIWLKFFTLSCLHHDHAAGIGEVARCFDHATFVFPEQWIEHRQGFSHDNAARCTPAVGPAFSRQLAFPYDDVWEFDLAGEPLIFMRAPFCSPTDQLVIFRGVALRPDWQLPLRADEPLQLADACDADKRATMRRILDLDRTYRVHSHLSAHGDGGLEADFTERVGFALAALRPGD